MTSFTYDAVLANETAEWPAVAADLPSARQAWALLEASGALAMQLGASGNILQATQASAALLAYPLEYLLRSSMQDIVSFEERERTAALLQSCAHKGESSHERIRFACGMVGSRWIDVRMSPHVTDDGTPCVLVFGHDVTQWIESEQRLVAQSFRDPLTGIGNRAYIRMRIGERLAAGLAGQPPLAVALMDLDGFKKVNDSLGHEFGDALLKELAVRLEGTMRSSNMVARLGGDEFVLLLDGVTSEEDAVGVLDRIIHVCRQPFHLAGCQVRVTTSVGLAFATGTEESESQLLRRADLAMYEAKAQGKNRFHVYSPQLDHRLNEQFRIEQSMFEAVQNGEFVLYYQPIVWPGSGEVCAAEALMRWESPNGMIAPDKFIPAAEGNGLIKHLGAWALRCACAQLALWDASGFQVGHISVNVSPVQFQHPGFADSVRRAIEDAGISAHRLVLEITEGVLMTDPKTAEAVLVELRALGIRFAVDDFGTGYSSLAYLRRFPLSALKIDRSFVADMVESPHARTIVSAVLSLARELGLVAIAEGVETDAQRDLLMAQGCDLVQGWRYARAMSPAQFEEAVREGRHVISSADVFTK
ncbi:EAL domain-containing protein [Cupriavidus respiraculi]|uniref:putative bifunctional diguanylate cyclase/phosphodiesterase n=1 Tax=Cupriavidus respiraculi TaxID=195930 RepID=UPI001C9442D6|nr:EAL domain-containing protein [Cupriavidus respiraculi]MBY4947751.1 EAL domain-containing protein [Cupriavidus respiraculi]